MLKDVKNLSSFDLVKRIEKCNTVETRTNGAFNNVAYDCGQELAKRAYKAIYQVCCRCLKNRGRNQFAAAKMFTDAVMNDSNFFAENKSYEIGGYYIKSGHPVVVTW